MSQKSKFVSLAELKKASGVETDQAVGQEGLVYSTVLGRTCPDCGKAKAECVCRQSSQSAGDGRVRVSRETKGRKGKGVTLVTGLPVSGEALKNLAKRLKQVCGTGGTVKEGIIEIQGDHRDKLVEKLTDLGYTVKKSGG